MFTLAWNPEEVGQDIFRRPCLSEETRMTWFLPCSILESQIVYSLPRPLWLSACESCIYPIVKLPQTTIGPATPVPRQHHPILLKPRAKRRCSNKRGVETLEPGTASAMVVVLNCRSSDIGQDQKECTSGIPAVSQLPGALALFLPSPTSHSLSFLDMISVFLVLFI